MDITVDKEYASLPVGLTWDNIPDFAVLTGKNGCGKTQLLRYIKYKLTQKDGPYVNHEICLIHEGLKLDYKSPNSNRTLLLQELIASLRQHKVKAAHQDKNSDLLIEIASSIGKNLSELESYDIVGWASETINSGDQLKKIIALYETCKREKAIDLYDSPVDEAVKIKNKSPCELINELLADYNSLFLIEEPKFPKSINPDKFDFNINFINKETNHKAVFSQLSTGEQSLIQMMIAIYNSKGVKSSKFLLLDEVDRHLHPSSCQELIKIIRDKFVKEYGIKVILTTHCLATIALCPDENLFLMEKNSKEIRNITKKEAMQSISDDVLSYEDGMKIINKISASNEPIILLVEGRYDVNHINIAKEKLKISTGFDIVSCDG